RIAPWHPRAVQARPEPPVPDRRASSFLPSEMMERRSLVLRLSLYDFVLIHQRQTKRRVSRSNRSGGSECLPEHWRSEASSRQVWLRSWRTPLGGRTRWVSLSAEASSLNLSFPNLFRVEV